MKYSILALLGFATATQTFEKCHAIAYSGGANRGAYEAGVTWQLVQDLPLDQVAWQSVSGVSAGSVNTGAVSLFAPEDAKAMADFLVERWQTLTTDKVWRYWTYEMYSGLLEGFYEKGMVDSDPLVDYLKDVFEQFDYNIKKMVTVTATSIDNGSVQVFTEKNTDLKDFPMAVVSSSSIPFVFPHRRLRDQELMDGGMTYGTNPVGAVERCREAGYDDKNIVLDIILCWGNKLEHSEMQESTTIGNFMRSWDIENQYHSMTDVYEFMGAYPNVQNRYLIFPHPQAPMAQGLDMLFFTQEIMDPMLQAGKEDAKAAIKLGEGKMFDHFKNYMDIHKQYDVEAFRDYLRLIQ